MNSTKNDLYLSYFGKGRAEMGCRSIIHRKLDEFRHDGKFCDITIRVQNTPVTCHRVVLATVSEFFEAMFCSSFIENEKKEISLPAVDSTFVFECILDFAYLGRIPNFSDPKIDVFEILKVCDFLRIFDLTEICIHYLIEHVSSIENVCEIFLFSCVANYPLLCDALSSYIAENFCVVSQKEEFLLMPYEQLNMVLKNYEKLNDETICSSVIFRDDDLLLDAMIRWILHVFQDRKRHFLELVSIVNFEKVSKNYIEFLSNKYKVNLPRFADLKSCLEAFFMFETRDTMPAVVYQSLLENSAMHVFVKFSNPDLDDQGISILSLGKYQSMGVSERKSYRNNFSVKIVALDNPCNYLYCLSFEKRSFFSYSSISLNKKKTLKTPSIDYYSSSRMCGFQNNSIYLYDSCSRFQVSSGTQRIVSILHYKCDLDKWFTVPNLKESMSFSKLVADDKLVYLIGGEKENERSNFSGYVQAFDYRVPRWLELTRPDTKMSFNSYASGCCCCLNGAIYASDARKIEVFDLEAGKWEILSHNPYTQNRLILFHTMVSFDNKLWIYFSSSQNQFETEECSIFDPNTRIWYPNRPFTEYILNKCYEGYLNPASEEDGLKQNDKLGYDVLFHDSVVFKPLDD